MTACGSREHDSEEEDDTRSAKRRRGRITTQTDTRNDRTVRPRELSPSRPSARNRRTPDGPTLRSQPSTPFPPILSLLSFLRFLARPAQSSPFSLLIDSVSPLPSPSTLARQCLSYSPHPRFLPFRLSRTDPELARFIFSPPFALSLKSSSSLFFSTLHRPLSTMSLSLSLSSLYTFAASTPPSYWFYFPLLFISPFFLFFFFFFFLFIFFSNCFLVLS